MENLTPKALTKKKKRETWSTNLISEHLFFFFGLALNQVQHTRTLDEGIEEKLQGKCRVIGMKLLSFLIGLHNFDDLSLVD